MPKDIVCDLFSGFGTATMPFELDPNYAVLRYEINKDVINHPRTPPTIKANLLKYPLKYFPNNAHGHVKLVWVSTPCTDHSNGYNAPKIKARREGRKFTPDMSFLRRAINIVEWIKPQYVVYENVIGAIEDFRPYLGEPRQIFGNVVLWGNYPLLDVDISQLSNDKTQIWGGSEFAHNERSVIDPVISQALYDAIQNQQTLF
jgi:site-specific DNA-cytosine methylase